VVEEVVVEEVVVEEVVVEEEEMGEVVVWRDGGGLSLFIARCTRG
jgi:hypothetical protein